MEARDFLLSYDPIAFRKHFKNIGRAYREQATALIEMCRLYADAAPKTYTEDDRLQKYAPSVRFLCTFATLNTCLAFCDLRMPH